MAIIGTHNEQGAYPVIFLQESQTWACPVAMEAIVYVIGAGGSGSAIGGSQDASQNGRGGAAGGCAVSRLTLAAQNYTVTIGSGGEYKDTSGALAGADGGNSVFDNSGGTAIATMTGNGGAGGTISTSAQNVTTGGGTATGGNLMNNTGGGGGGTTTTTSATSAGGGVNLYGSDTHGTGQVSGSWGAGGRPHGISTTGTTSSPDYNYYLAGSGGALRNEDIAVSYFSQFITHQGGQSGSYARGGYGLNVPLAGSKQNLIFSTYNTASAIYAINAPFCGGNGFKGSNGGSGRVVGCAGGVGAGGGGTMAQDCDAYSGAGGSGLIMIFPTQLG